MTRSTDSLQTADRELWAERTKHNINETKEQVVAFRPQSRSPSWLGMQRELLQRVHISNKLDWSNNADVSEPLREELWQMLI